MADKENSTSDVSKTPPSAPKVSPVKAETPSKTPPVQVKPWEKEKPVVNPGENQQIPEKKAITPEQQKRLQAKDDATKKYTTQKEQLEKTRELIQTGKNLSGAFSLWDSLFEQGKPLMDVSVQNSEKQFSELLASKHNTEIAAIVWGEELAKIGSEAHEKAYRSMLEGRITETIIPDFNTKKEEVKKQLTKQDEAFKKLSPDEQDKRVREEVVENQTVACIQAVEIFRALSPEDKKKPENLQKLQDVSGWKLDMWDLLQDEKVKDQIIKNIQEKGILASGVEVDKGIWASITAEQRKTLEAYTAILWDKMKLQDLPIDIRQKLIFENSDSQTSLLKSTYWENIPEKVENDIFRTKREIFRQKADETDEQYTQRAEKDLKKQTGISMKEVPKNMKISPLVRFLADLLAPLGAMMGGKTGEFWRGYLQQNGTPEQQKKWAENSRDYYGREWATVVPKNRESHEANLRSYKWCDKPVLLADTVSKMNANRGKYEEVSRRLEQKTGGKKKIPWEVIAAIHYREGDMNFHTYLHNGNRLGKPTTDVPAGINFPDSEEGWLNASVDALGREAYLDNMKTDSLGGLANIAEYSEKYNGPAYRNKGKNSPYVWAWSSGLSVAGLIMKDHGPITDRKDERLGIMPIVMELAGYTHTELVGNTLRSQLTDKYKTIISWPDKWTETPTDNPAEWFKKNAGKWYGGWDDKFDCMTSTNTALWLPYEQHVRTFGSQYILQEWKDGTKKPQDLWNVSMAAAVYVDKLRWPTTESSKEKPIKLESDGWYGWAEKAQNPNNMEYYIEENVMKRVKDEGTKDVLGNGLFMHYSNKNIDAIVSDIQGKLQDGQSAMMWATGQWTNLHWHEWLVANERGSLKVYESTHTGKEDWRWEVNGISGKWLDLKQYLQNRPADYSDEAIIFAKRPQAVPVPQNSVNPESTSQKSEGFKWNAFDFGPSRDPNGVGFIGDSHTNLLTDNRGYEPYDKVKRLPWQGDESVTIPTVISGGNMWENWILSVPKLLDKTKGIDYIKWKKEIIICLGTNDAPKTVQENKDGTIDTPGSRVMVANMNKIIEKVKAIKTSNREDEKDYKILVVMPPKNANSNVNKNIEGYLAWLIGKKPENDTNTFKYSIGNNVSVADFYTYSQRYNLQLSDKDHLNTQGYAVMRQFINNNIEGNQVLLASR